CHLTGYAKYPFLPTYDNTAYASGSTAFDSKVDFTTGTNPYCVAIGDIDGDGKADLISANLGSNTISVFRNTASSGTINSSSFASKVDFTAGTSAYNVTVCDIDGDGKLDVLASNYGAATVSVFRNTAVSGTITSGSLAAKMDFTAGSGPLNVVASDLDGD